MVSVMRRWVNIDASRPLWRNWQSDIVTWSWWGPETNARVWEIIIRISRVKIYCVNFSLIPGIPCTCCSHPVTRGVIKNNTQVIITFAFQCHNWNTTLAFFFDVISDWSIEVEHPSTQKYWHGISVRRCMVHGGMWDELRRLKNTPGLFLIFLSGNTCSTKNLTQDP